MQGNQSAPPPPPSTPQTFGYGHPQGYSFQYSQCNGRRKALLVGINYFGQRGQLRGCINDVRNMSAYLIAHFQYKREDMVILTDDQQNPMSQPTKQNILRAMHWLVKDARPNDSLFFHYSGKWAQASAAHTQCSFLTILLGHGGQTKDLDGDEDDGYDEVIYPVDFRQVGHITDDEMHRILVKPLQAGVRLTAIFDSCHSGTALDLPYIYSTQGVLKEPNLAKEAGQDLLSVISSYGRGDIGGILKTGLGFFNKATKGEDAHARALATKTSPADVIMLSGSKDNQTSYVSLLFLFVLLLHHLGLLPLDWLLAQGSAAEMQNPIPMQARCKGILAYPLTTTTKLFSFGAPRSAPIPLPDVAESSSGTLISHPTQSHSFCLQ